MDGDAKFHLSAMKKFESHKTKNDTGGYQENCVNHTEKICSHFMKAIKSGTFEQNERNSERNLSILCLSAVCGKQCEIQNLSEDSVISYK